MYMFMYNGDTNVISVPRIALCSLTILGGCGLPLIYFYLIT